MYDPMRQGPARTKKRKSVKDLMKKQENTVSEKTAGDAVRNLLQASMSKGKVKAIKLKVKMK